MIHAPQGDSGSQFSILHDGGRQLLYCCHTVRTRDMAGNAHVLSAGIDLAPALEANGDDAASLIAEVNASCAKHGGEGVIPAAPRAALRRVAKVLNIEWVETALDKPARIICPRAGGCPRPQRCAGAAEQRAPVVTDVIERIMSRTGKKGRRKVIA
jgi:hypothetical protein